MEVNIKSAETGKIEKVELTEEIARKLLDKWVRVLHLEEWRIKFEWKVRDTDMAAEDSVGCTSADVVDRQALIQMLDPVDYKDRIFPYDYEKTLVHELLHLTFWDMDSSGDELRDRLTHIMVDRMARALLSAERGVGVC